MGVSSLPEVARLPGEVVAYAGAAAPAGWLLCNGALVSTTTYASLFAVVGHTYNRGAGNGGAGAAGSDPGGGNFYLPNLQGRVIVGVDTADAAFDVRGDWGGSKTSTAAHTHGHAHTHGMNSVDTNHAHNVYTTGAVTTGDPDRNHTHGVGHAGDGGNAGLTPGGNQYNIGYAYKQTDGVSQWHGHRYDHNHPSTNYQSEAPWAGTYSHGHTTNSQSASITGDSDVSAANGNLQPFVALNYIIKA